MTRLVPQVTPLLNGAFLPITANAYFLEVPARDVVKVYISWTESLPAPFAHQHSVAPIAGSLECLLSYLEPLTNNADKMVFLKTDSPWTAIFVNRYYGGDFYSATSYLSQLHRWRAVIATYLPDWTELCGRPKDGPLGARGFSYYAPNAESPDVIKRVVQVGNEGSRWDFSEVGPIQEFEDAAAYRRRRRNDRVTPELIDSYCRSLGISVLSSDFYGPEGYLVERTDKSFQGVSLCSTRRVLFVCQISTKGMGRRAW